MTNKKFFTSIALACSLTSISSAATMLTVGDITIVGFSADGTDQFAFVNWVDLDASTEIQFTDYGWSHNDTSFTTGSVNDDALTWSTNGTALSAGSLVVITANGTSSSVASGGGAIVGGGFGSISSSGESIFAFTGTEASPNFIFGLYTHQTTWDAPSNVIISDATDSSLPVDPGNSLNVAGGNLIPIAGTTPNDNGLWDLDKDGGVFADLAAAKAHALDPTNWIIENADDGSGSFSDNLLMDLDSAAGGTFVITVPEPSTSLTLVFGLAALCFSRKRK